MNNQEKKLRKTFRFPFDIDRRIFLGLAVFFLILSIKPVNKLFFPRLDEEALVEKIEESVRTQQKDFLDLVKDKNFIEKFAQSKLDEEELIALNNKNWGLSAYQGDSLIAWSNERLINEFKPPIDKILTAYDEKGVVGACLTQIVEVNRVKYNIKGSFPIYFTYKNENDFLASNLNLNEVRTKADDDYGYKISVWNNEVTIPGAYKINFGQEASFAFEEKNDFLDLFDKNPWHLFFAALPFIFFGISIHTFFKVSVKRNPLLYFALLVGTAFLIRILTYWVGLPDNFSEFNLFNPELYAAGLTRSSLGDLLINRCLIFWILLFFFINVQFKIHKPKNKKHYNYFIPIYCLFLFWIGFQSFSIGRSLVFDSIISYNLTDYRNLTFESFIGISTFLIIFINYALAIIICHRYLKKTILNAYLKYFIPLLIIPFVYFLQAEDVFLEYVFILAWTSLFFIILDIKFFETKFDFNSYKLLYWFIFLAMSCTIMFNHLVLDKEKNDRANSAYAILNFEDPITAIKLNAAADSLLNLGVFKNITNAKSEIEKQRIFSNATAKYLVPFKNEFQVKLENLDSIAFAQFNESLIPINDNSSSRLYINKTFGREAYYLVNQSDNSNMVISFTPYEQLNFNNQKINLFRQRKNQVDYFEENYELGFYENGKLTQQINSFSFPYTCNYAVQSKEQIQLANNLSLSSFAYRFDKDGKERILVFNKKRNLIYQITTTYAFFFSIIFLIISFYILGNILARSNFKWSRFVALFGLTLRMRIHLSILIVELIAFIIIGIVTVLYYNSRIKEDIDVKSVRTNKLIKEEVEKLYNYNNFNVNDSVLSNDEIIALDGICKNVQVSNANIFNLEGKMIYSSEPNNLSLGLFGNYINPIAKYKIQSQENHNIEIEESISKFNYISNYSYLTDAKGNHLGYIQVPNLTSKHLIKSHISTVLITLINIYTIIFLLSSIIAFFITNRLTRSFTTIVTQFSKINLTQTNKQLSWPYNDEIGLLVKEYNRTLLKLENSTQLLAKSERETAWREMAKQIAHEIKNPLTPMRLSLQMLQMAIKNNDPRVPEKTKKMTNTVLEQITVLTRIATNFSEFAKMTDINAKKESLREILKSATGIYSDSDSEEFLFILPPDDVYVNVDRVKIIRVITNVIQNAIQAIDDNIIANITLTTNQLNKKLVRVSITDNGSGIEDELGKKIFQPNFTTKNSGSGLGLAMCKDIMTKTGGDITFESDLGMGTTFYIDIPYYAGEVVEEEAEDEDYKLLQESFDLEFDDDDENDEDALEEFED